MSDLFVEANEAVRAAREAGETASVSEGFVNRYWEAIRAGWRDQRVPWRGFPLRGPDPRNEQYGRPAQASSTSADEQQRGYRQILPTVALAANPDRHARGC
jgi:hypothetical protein